MFLKNQYVINVSNPFMKRTAVLFNTNKFESANDSNLLLNIPAFLNHNPDDSIKIKRGERCRKRGRSTRRVFRKRHLVRIVHHVERILSYSILALLCSIVIRLIIAWNFSVLQHWVCMETALKWRIASGATCQWREEMGVSWQPCLSIKAHAQIASI